MKLTKELLQAFVQHLEQEERSENTIQKYQRDIGAFYDFCGGDVSITKQTVPNYNSNFADVKQKQNP